MNTREALLATVRARLGMAAEASQQGEIKVELIDEPVDIRSAVDAKDLGQLGALAPALQSVGHEDVGVVRDALLLLRLRASAVDIGNVVIFVARSK